LLYFQDPAVDEFDISKDVFEVVRKFGIPCNKDFNGAKQNGVGRYQKSNKFVEPAQCTILLTCASYTLNGR